MSFNSKKKGNIHFKVYLAFPFLDELVDEGPEELVPALRDVVAPQLEKMFKMEVGRTFLKKIKIKTVEKNYRQICRCLMQNCLYSYMLHLF